MRSPFEGPGGRQRIRLAARKTLPEMEDIRALVGEADRGRGKLVEQPFILSDQVEPFVLTAQFDFGADTPIWCLYQGEGSRSQLVWSCAERDLYLICDVVCMFMSSAQPPAAKATPDEPQPAPSAFDVQPPTYFETITPVDFELLKQKPNILLGYLLVEAGLLPEPVLDEALKLQEMVRNESLTPLQAIHALRRAYARSSGESGLHEPVAAGKTEQKAGQAEVRPVVDLLKQAGLVTEDDVKTASQVQRKHGGELDKILVAARKVSEVTMEAAHTCWPMVRDGLIKPEQAIIALHYCERMRVGFKEAASELGWDLTL